MVVIRIHKNDMHALMIDGFSESSEYLKKDLFRIPGITTNPISRVKYELAGYFRKNQEFSENLELLFFRRLVEKSRAIFCPHAKQKTIHDINTNKPCFYRFLTANSNYYDIARNLQQLPHYERSSIEHILPVLILESNNNTSLGKIRYSQHVILYDRCKAVNKCYTNWITNLNFRIKSPTEYKNFRKFKLAWIDYLSYHLAYYLKGQVF